ncbi:hypothetical protein Dimus_017561 [Dionaea muscipula]
MVTGWRRAFCTSIPKDHEPKIATHHQTQQDQQPPQPPLPLPPTPTPQSSGDRKASISTGHHCTPTFVSKFNFFSSSSGGSNPSTPHLQTPQALTIPKLLSFQTKAETAPATPASASPAGGSSPRLQCKTARSSRFFQRSNPSSPRSPSPFSLLKNTLRFTKVTRCGVCAQSIKTGQGTAIFTAECSHAFHFPCLAANIGKHGGLACPVCGSGWKEVPLLTVHKRPTPQTQCHHNSIKKSSFNESASFDLKVYNDDESLMSSIAGGGHFNPIPESDENDDDEVEEAHRRPDGFPGFSVKQSTRRSRVTEESSATRDIIEARISADAAVVAVGRSHETYAVVLKVKASPPAPANLTRRAAVDLVAVIDVGGSMTSSKLQMTKRAIKLLISSMSSTDRLSMVAFSSSSKRLSPLRRMTPAGRRSARRIVDSLVSSNGSCVNDALRKAAKVLDDRRERNPACCVFLFAGGGDEISSGSPVDVRRQPPLVSSTRFSHEDIPVHSVSLTALSQEPAEEAFAHRIGVLLTVVALDVRLQIRLVSDSAPGQISSVYSCTGRPGLLSSGSTKLGDLYADEEREILLELKVPSAGIGSHHILAVRSFFKAPLNKELIYGHEQALLVPRPHSIRSSDPSIRRLRTLFMITRAVAESRKLVERNDLAGAQHLLSSALASLTQSASSIAVDQWVRGVEAELAELKCRRQSRVVAQRGRSPAVEEKEEPLTPTSAWKAAERLAKVAIMRKSMNRVSDLHGLENARF